jgi:serine/threonine protein kinase
MADSAQAEAGNTGPLPGGTLLQNRYLIERLLGGGGMGVVYLARDQRLANRPCAIKEMIDHFIDPQQRRQASEYFAGEADVLANLRHPAIPAISDRFDQANRHYLVMEYVEGHNLEEAMSNAAGRPLDESLVVDIARQLCEVLAYLHNLNPPIIYRDMKPSNVMLTPKGRVMLIDFGIARLFKPASKGTMIGTLGFAPPEQYQGRVDPRSDIYSLGATLHYVLTARDPEKFPPFSFPPVRELRPGVSANLAGAVDHALAYEAENRPATIGEFRDMLLYGTGLSNIAHAPVSARSGTADLTRFVAPQPAPAPPRHRRSRLRRTLSLAFFTVMLGSVAFGATYVYTNPQLAARLGLTPLINQLPWRHAELIAELRAHPLKFERVTLQLSTREGSPLSPPEAHFTNVELGNNRYLYWKAAFTNQLKGIEGRDDHVEARFFDPNGMQIASSSNSQFVGPDQEKAEFSGVAMMPETAELSRGAYKIGLYLGDQALAEEQFSVVQDIAAEQRAAQEKHQADAKAAAAAAAATAAREAEARKVAMLEERRAHPLQLVNILFLNTTKTGTPLSGATDTFDASKVLFVGWEALFKNRLYGLDMNQYRVDAAYVAPDGRTLGSVDDVRMVAQNARTVSFSGRIGNSAGGAFLPGVYNVNFYLNGQFLAARKFRVKAADLASATAPAAGLSMPASAPPALDSPTVANGTIDGLGGRDGIAMELRLRPQPNGFLHGTLVIHEPGYGSTPIDGFVRGEHVEFQVPYGTKTLYFEGERRNEDMSGSFQSEPAGDRGNWTARVD